MNRHVEDHDVPTQLADDATLREAVDKINDIIAFLVEVKWTLLGRDENDETETDEI